MTNNNLKYKTSLETLFVVEGYQLKTIYELEEEKKED